jgi:hypothetical protein
MISEYLTETNYLHPDAKKTDLKKVTVLNGYAIVSFMLSSGYCFHRETKDNGEAPRGRVKELLGDWLTEERERQLFLRHKPTLNTACERITNILFHQ